MKILIVEFRIGFKHAMKIVSFFKKKKHAVMGYYFELSEADKFSAPPLYSERYERNTELFDLKVFRDKEDRQTCEVHDHPDLPPLSAEVMFIISGLLLGTSLKDQHADHPSFINASKNEDRTT